MANETVLFKRGDSATITSTPVTDGQILFDTSGNGKMYLDNGTDRLEMGGAITVDASLSKTSTNAIQNKAVTGNILNSLAEVSAATQQNTIAGALALKEVNSSLTDLGGFKPVIDETTGEITGYKTTIGGADTVFPFKSFDLNLNPTLINQTNYTATDDCVAFIHGSGGYSPWKIVVAVNDEEVINHTQSNNGYVSFALQLSKDDIINLSFTGFSTLGTGIDIFI